LFIEYFTAFIGYSCKIKPVKIKFTGLTYKAMFAVFAASAYSLGYLLKLSAANNISHTIQ
jgi:hypothetical protein